MGSISDKLTALADSSEVNSAIFDLANVEAIDSSIAGQLIRIAQILKMVGVTSIFCGILGGLAKTMVMAGVDIGGFLVVRDLKAALIQSFRISGYRLVRQKGEAEVIALDSQA